MASRNLVREKTIFDWCRSRRVTVRNGAIVGSLSVLTKDVQPYAIVAGAPAQFIKWRHPEDIATRLQAKVSKGRIANREAITAIDSIGRAGPTAWKR